MQALILAGGQGTRLRPLTSMLPKPAVPLVNEPFTSYMLDWLAEHGVDDVIISSGHLADVLKRVLGEEEHDGVRLRYVEEDEPLGTAGAVKLAEPFLDERFFVLNGDVLTDLNLTELIGFHERAGAVGTLALTPVEDPTVFGLVRTGEGGAIREFVEKPSRSECDSNLINAGAYVLEREALAGCEPGRNTSFEREVFPSLIGRGLYAVEASGYWLDIGTPDRYLQGTFDILERNVRTRVGERMGESFLLVDSGVDVDGARVVPPAVVGAGTRVAAGGRIGSLASVGEDCAIDRDAVVESAVLHSGVHLERGSVVRRAAIAREARIGRGTVVENGAVVGERATIGAGNVISAGMRVAPGVEIPPDSVRF